MISEKKLKAFALGEMGRRGTSKRQAEEARERQEKEAVGKAYKEFVDTFQGSGPGKTWIKAGTLDPASRSAESGGGDKGEVYKPESKISRPEMAQETMNKRPEKLGSKKKSTEKKKSNLESFKEELKAIQEEREERSRFKSMIKSENPPPVVKAPLLEPRNKDPSGSHDVGDPNTTNLYLGNLSPRLNEQQMMEIFGKYGPLASIKIMWPRTEDEKSRGRNCGFVAYMCRSDGERALANLLGKDIDGFEMKIGWGKPVPIPLYPIYIPPKMFKLTLPPPASGLPFNGQCDDTNELEKAQSYDPTSNPEDRAKLDKFIHSCVVHVIIPTDRTQLCLINRTIEFVIREGPMFEAMIMNREMSNPSFRFLFENKSPEHIYYRWRLYSFLQGDSREKWSTKEFRMFKGGSLWKPPPMNLFSAGMPDEFVDDEDFVPVRRQNKGNSVADDPATSVKKEEVEDPCDEELARNNKRGMSDSQRDRFEEMLRNLVPDRNPVAESMVWCIEHADAGQEIVECIAESLSIPETPLVKKIARLYLISDILHNCSVKGITNVSYYRKGFQAKLPEIFDDLYLCYKNIESRIKAESFKQRVMQCFRAWEDWALYPQDFLINLQNKFLGLTAERVEVANDVTPTHVEEGSDEEDVDGIPLDGAALLKSAAKTGSEVIKIPITRDSDDSDIDGAPIDEPHTLKSNPSSIGVSGFIPSKWETVDPEDVQAQAVTSKWDIFDEFDKEKQKNKNKDDDDEDIDGVPIQQDDDEVDTRVSESRRAKLRDIEIKVMSFQDQLETGKRPSKSGWTISEQVEHFRKKLMRKELRSTESGGGEDRNSSRSRKRKNSKRKSGRSSSSSRSRSRSKERSSRRRRRRSSSSNNGSPVYESSRRRSRSRSPRRSSRRSRSRSPKKHKKKRH